MAERPVGPEGTVWVVQEVPGKNILPAQAWGMLDVLIPANSQVVLDSGPTVDMIHRKLRDFSDKDYLIAIGDPAAIGIACAVAAAKNDGRFKLLKWDRQEGRYYPVSVNVN